MIAGIDFDTYAVHVARLSLLDLDTAVVRSVPLRLPKRSGEDFGYDALTGIFEALDSLPWTNVPVAYIERGFGGSRRSDYALGAVFGAIHAVLPLLNPRIVVNRVGLGEWRKIVTGNGNADTEATRAALYERGVLIEKHGARFDPRSEAVTKDEVDATAIAWAGRDLNRRAFDG